MKKIVYAIVFMAFVGLSLAALQSLSTSAVSSSSCSACHIDGRTQYLDILEGNAGNIFPATINVGETKTVSVIIENRNSVTINNVLSSVTASLSSQNGRFSVASPTVNIGTLSTGTATASWQITGSSAGTDSFVISASAVNTHKSGLTFSDSYSGAPSITVVAATPPPPPPTTYTLTITTSGSGTVTKNPDTATYNAGTVVQLTATPATGWSFTGWSGSVMGTTNPTSLTMNSNAAILATFTQNTSLPPPPSTTNTVTTVVIDTFTSLPISGASVSIGSSTVTTGTDGVATMVLNSGTYTLTITKAGYITFSQSLTISTSTLLVKTLSPVQSPPTTPNQANVK